MSVLVAFAGYQPNDRQLAFQRQLDNSGIQWIYQSMPHYTFRIRREWQQAVAATYRKHQIVFTDACDYVFFGATVDELSERVKSLGPVCFPAQRECWPVPEWEGSYPDPEPRGSTPWRFLNASGPHGLGEAIADSIADCRDKYPLTDVPGELHGIDEWAWQQMHMAGLVGVDTSCQLTTCLSKTNAGELELTDGRLHNLTTGSYPLFLHANGSSFTLNKNYIGVFDAFLR